jgi:tricarballylate dehydrogenase
VFPPVRANSIRELATAVGLEPDALEETVNEFNAAVQPGEFDHNVLDNCATRELTPPKTHWARTIDTAPYFAYPLRPGITFTYLSVVVDEHARIIMQDDKPSANMYAAGEIMSGNVLGKGYLGGFGMALGTVFGRIAGEEAAHHAGK